MSKRRRTDGDEAELSAGEEKNAEPVPVKRSEEVWLDDGNVILQAENVQFRVHRSVLSKHSPVFSGLFKVPHPPGEPNVDGIPIVVLHDSPEDLKHVLLALYGDP